jgi:hypothetical protein
MLIQDILILELISGLKDITHPRGHKVCYAKLPLSTRIEGMQNSKCKMQYGSEESELQLGGKACSGIANA